MTLKDSLITWNVYYIVGIVSSERQMKTSQDPFPSVDELLTSKRSLIAH